MNRTLIIIAALMLFTACDSTVLYDETARVDEKGWHYNDALTFNFSADDTTTTYTCYLDIRNRNDYPYSNIYLNIVTIYPDGAVAADTNLQFVLAQPDGQWLGRYNGRYVDGRYPFCRFRFPQQGSYQFVIRHAMRDTILPGILDVGMHISRVL